MPQILTVPVAAIMALSSPLRLAPPEKPAKATGHWVDCGHSFRMSCNAAARRPSRQTLESRRALIVASVASTIQPSGMAGSRYQLASIGLVRPKSVVDVTIRIGQLRAGSKFGGNIMTAWPLSGDGLPPCA